MRQITVRLPDDMIEELDREADERAFDSRAGRIREVLAGRGGDPELQTEVDELRDECERLRTEVERLQRERRQLLEVREENTALVSVAERQQSLAERKAQASIFKKAKWAITGMPSGD
jgi:Arc/MetJ-type ribon-helix-helix transcriptional regulator